MIGSGDVAECVLIPGDPKRVELMAQHLQDSKKISENRQFVTITGWFKEVRVSIVSSGIGVPATLIVVEELYRVGAKTLIRVGTTGGLQKNVDVGDIVIAEAAVRTEGGTQAYAPLGYPAIANRSVVNALIEACLRRSQKFHGGIIWTSEAYYAESPQLAKMWHDLNVISVEMESSALFTLSSIRRLKAGSILVVDGNLVYGKKKGEIPRNQQAYDPLVLEGIHKVTEVSLDAIVSIQRSDGTSN
jgi:uridine phosphorylase